MRKRREAPLKVTTRLSPQIAALLQVYIIRHRIKGNSGRASADRDAGGKVTPPPPSPLHRSVPGKAANLIGVKWCRSITSDWQLTLARRCATLCTRQLLTDSYLTAVFSRVCDVRSGLIEHRRWRRFKRDNSRPCLARLPRHSQRRLNKAEIPSKARHARLGCGLFFNLQPTACASPSVVREPQVTLIWSCHSTPIWIHMWLRHKQANKSWREAGRTSRTWFYFYFWVGWGDFRYFEPSLVSLLDYFWATANHKR